MGNITDRFLDKTFSLDIEGIPGSSLIYAKNFLLDYLGVTLAGAEMGRSEMNALLETAVANNGDFTVIGLNRRSNLENAILVNGFSSHIAELDDGHRLGMIHLGSPIISSLLPLVEMGKVDGRRLLYGIIIGYEAAVQLSAAIQPSHKKKGYHATATCGTIGAALGVAAALGYSRNQIKTTLAAAATSASGILEIQENGSQLKPYNSARAALNGYLSALIGSVELNSPDDILGGKQGFLAIMCDQYDPSYLYQPTDRFWIESAYMKKYASCRHSHSAVEATLNIVNQYGIKPSDIEEVIIRTYQLAVLGHDHKVIEGISSAKMSTPYSVAVAIKTGKAGIREYSQQYINDSEIISLLDKIRIEIDPQLTLNQHEQRSAMVKIVTSDKTNYNETVYYAKGDPQNPLSQQEIKEKFLDLAMYGRKTKPDAEQIIRMIHNEGEDLAQLFKLL